MDKIYRDFYKYATTKKIDGRYVSGSVLDDYSKKSNLFVPKNVLNPLDYQSVSVVDESPNNHAILLDIFSVMIKNRIIFVGDIDDESARIMSAQLLYLSNVDNETPVSLYVESNGGGCYCGYSLIDVMDYIPNTCKTVVTGIAASFGALIAMNGSYGQRFIQPNATMMIHQPLISGGVGGPTDDIVINANEMLRLKNDIHQLIAHRSGHTVEEIEALCPRDKWLTAQEAIEWHFCDKVLDPHPSKTMSYAEYIKPKKSEA